MTTQDTMRLALEWIEAQPEPRMIGAAKIIKALKAALAQQGEQQPVTQKVDIPAMAEVEFSRLTGEIQRLAVSIWSSDYRSESPHWTVLPDAFGALSQISNMVSGMERKAAPAAQPLSDKRINEMLNESLLAGADHSLKAWARRVEREHGIGVQK